MPRNRILLLKPRVYCRAPSLIGSSIFCSTSFLIWQVRYALVMPGMAGTMDIGEEVVQDIPQKTLSTRKWDTVMTLAERLYHKGLMAGRQEGMQKGLLEGQQR